MLLSGSAALAIILEMSMSILRIPTPFVFVPSGIITTGRLPLYQRKPVSYFNFKISKYIELFSLVTTSGNLMPIA